MTKIKKDLVLIIFVIVMLLFILFGALSSRNNNDTKNINAKQISIHSFENTIQDMGNEVDELKTVMDYERNIIISSRSEGIEYHVPEEKSDNVVFSESDEKALAKLLYCEARGEPEDGQIMVALTVLNRYNTKMYGNSIYEICHSSQYALKNRNVPVLEDLLNISRKTLNGEYNNLHPDNMIYFRVTQSKSDWWGYYYKTVGNHSFYTLK